MAVVDVAIAAGTFLGVGGGGVAAGLVGGAAIGAGAGALYSGITGDGNILNSALTGAAIGGAFGGIGAGLGLTGASGTSLGLSGTGAFGTAATAATPALTAATLPSAIPEVASGASAFGGTGAATVPITGDAGIAALSAPSTVAPAAAPTASTLLETQTPALTPWQEEVARTQANTLTPASVIKPPSTGLTGMEMLGYGLAGTTALSLLGGMNQNKIQTGTVGTQNQPMIRPYTYNVSQNQSAYPTTPQYGPNGLPILPKSEKSYFNQSYTAGTPYNAAAGGLMSVPTPGLMDSGRSGNVDFMGGDMYPTSQQHRSYYATPTQMPTSAQEVMASYEPKTNPLTGQMMKNMAIGGITYDATTQRYSGLPQMGTAPLPQVDPLPSDLVSQLTPQWQSANPHAYAYDPVAQRYSAATPNMNQLVSYKAEQDKIAAEQAAAAAQQIQSSYDGGGGANGGLMQAYAMGGGVDNGYNLGSYSDGGRLLKGPGDGVSDDIPAVIGNKQPARLADGEFVIPARIVSELGNGSTDAGAKRLYAMMDNIQAGRKKTIGKNNVAKDTKAKKHLLG